MSTTRQKLEHALAIARGDREFNASHAAGSKMRAITDVYRERQIRAETIIDAIEAALKDLPDGPPT